MSTVAAPSSRTTSAVAYECDRFWRVHLPRLITDHRRTPLSGLSGHRLAPSWHKVAAFVARNGERFYGFKGLRAYKEKFRPVWEPRYLASPGGWALPQILLDVTNLISGGPAKTLGKGARS